MKDVRGLKIRTSSDPSDGRGRNKTSRPCERTQSVDAIDKGRRNKVVAHAPSVAHNKVVAHAPSVAHTPQYISTTKQPGVVMIDGSSNAYQQVVAKTDELARNLVKHSPSKGILEDAKQSVRELERNCFKADCDTTILLNLVSICHAKQKIVKDSLEAIMHGHSSNMNDDPADLGKLLEVNDLLLNTIKVADKKLLNSASKQQQQQQPPEERGVHIFGATKVDDTRTIYDNNSVATTGPQKPSNSSDIEYLTRRKDVFSLINIINSSQGGKKRADASLALLRFARGRIGLISENETSRLRGEILSCGGVEVLLRLCRNSTGDEKVIAALSVAYLFSPAYTSSLSSKNGIGLEIIECLRFLVWSQQPLSLSGGEEITLQEIRDVARTALVRIKAKTKSDDDNVNNIDNPRTNNANDGAPSVQRKPPKAPPNQQSKISVQMVSRNKDIFSLICILCAGRDEERADASLALLRFARGGIGISESETFRLRNEIRSCGGVEALISSFKKSTGEVKVITALAVAYVSPSFTRTTHTPLSSTSGIGLKITECLRFLLSSEALSSGGEEVTPQEIREIAAIALVDIESKINSNSEANNYASMPALNEDEVEVAVRHHYPPITNPSMWSISYDQLIEINQDALRILGKKDYSQKTLRDINEVVIKPRCRQSGVSYALSLNPNGLMIDAFVSHSWDEPFEAFVDSIKQEFGCLPVKPNLWICAFALIQSDDESIVQAQLGGADISLNESPFVKALADATKYVIVRNRLTDIWGRCWCVCELMKAWELNLVPYKTHVTGPDVFCNLNTSIVDAKATNIRDQEKILRVLLDEYDVKKIDDLVQEFRAYHAPQGVSL